MVVEGSSLWLNPFSLGNAGIGTTSPSTLLSLVGSSGIYASTTATSTFQGGGINLTTAAGNTGCFAINGVCTPSLAMVTNLIGASYPFALSGNATSTLTQFNGGLAAFGSSTIGNGTQAGGLTISGGATTTGLLVVQGNATPTFAAGLETTALNITSSSASLRLAGWAVILAQAPALVVRCVAITRRP